MDIWDRATEIEERDREIAIRAARQAVNPSISKKRERLAIAQEIAGQHSNSDPESRLLDVLCENCDEPLTLSSDDIFCCKECASDWEKRDRARRIAGR